MNAGAARSRRGWRAASLLQLVLVGALLGTALLGTGCEQRQPSRPSGWQPYGAAIGPQPPQPYYATRGPDPYTMPGGSEARDPWGARPAASLVPASPSMPDGSSFLLVTTLQGPSASDREPSVNALLARLGGVRRAPSLWEVMPQPGGGLGSVAAALESELCAEDIVVVYRARGHAMERSEFAGHKVCAAPASPPSPVAPPKKPGNTDPLRTRF